MYFLIIAQYYTFCIIRGGELAHQKKCKSYIFIKKCRNDMHTLNPIKIGSLKGFLF